MPDTVEDYADLLKELEAVERLAAILATELERLKLHTQLKLSVELINTSPEAMRRKGNSNDDQE